MGMEWVIKPHSDNRHYAQTEVPYLVKGPLIEQKIAYPVVVKQHSDNKRRAWFNFEKPIASMEWDTDYKLRVTLIDGKKHSFTLDYLQSR